MKKKYFKAKPWMLTLAISILACSTSVAQRDPWQWPFSKESIWNTPIGSEAAYVEANLEAASHVGTDTQHIRALAASDPERPVLATYRFDTLRCSSSDSLGFSLPVPDDFIVPDAHQSPYGRTPNGNFAFLLPDDSTLFQGSLLSRCTEGGAIHMGDWYKYPNNRSYTSLYGDGLTGATGQGASGMSSLGGTLRLGELTGEAPIRHAIKINPWANKYLHYSEAVPGYRWPARRADGYANNPGSKNRYLGTDPKLVMGSLLAIPPDVTEESLGLTTEAGRKLFFTLKYYGAYFTEDAAWDTYDLIVERDAEVAFEQQYGFSMKSDTWKAEINKLAQALHIVDNNTPTSIGGGGTPLQPLAPDFEVAADPEPINPYVAIQAEDYNDQRGIQLSNDSAAVGYIQDGDYIGFTNLDFGNEGGKSFKVRASSATGGGTIEYRLGSPTGDLVGTVEVPNTGGWTSFETFTVNNGTGFIYNEEDIYLVFRGGDGFLLDVDWFYFSTEVFATGISITNCPTQIELGTTYDFDAEIVPSTTTDQFFQFTGASVNTISGEYIATSPGTRTVTVTSLSEAAEGGFVQDQCTFEVVDRQDSTASNQTLSARISQPTSTAVPRVYPNPGADGLFRIEGPEQISAVWMVTNLLGHPIARPSAEDAALIDLSGQPPGVYLLHTSDGKTVKLIKE